MNNNHFSLVDSCIEFSNNRIIKVIEEIGRGNSSIAYKCEIYKEENLEARGLLKEYVPNNYGFDGKISENKFYFTKKVNERFISRYLPAQKEQFVSQYNSYLNKIKETRNLLNQLKLEDDSISKYIVPVPDENDCLFNLDDEKNTYVAVQLFPFDAIDVDKKIKNISISSKLEMLEKLSLVVDRFHKQKFLITDLKPENFLYINDGITSTIKLFDFDSILELNDKYDLDITKEQRIMGTAFFSAPQVLRGEPFLNRSCDVYSIGAMLLYLVCFDIFSEIVPSIKNFGAKDLLRLKEKLNLQTFNMLLEATNDSKITHGFWNKFVNIVIKCMNPSQERRYDKNKDDSPMQQLSMELRVLKEIYENKGVHPEVMLNNAIILAETYKKNDFDECLFTNVKETTEN